jgi:ComF family protein
LAPQPLLSPAWFKRLGLNVLEFFLPRLCLFCGAAVGEAAAEAICPACAGEIEWVAGPRCTCCGLVFPAPGGGDRLCGDCQADPPPFARARAAAFYEGPVATAVKRLKFNRRLAYLPLMQSWLASPPCRELAAEADLIVPVPLHPRRLKQRGFNQAWLLAQAFPELNLARDLLIRVRHTIPQVQLNPKERRDNVTGAFAVAQPARVQGQNVLLVDDLFTTGATARECARVLSRAGAARVEVLTVARVKQP